MDLKLTDLNTSYVNVNPVLIGQIVSVVNNLNTSYVNVNQVTG